MIPSEVQIAQRILSESPRFGDRSQIEALKIMEKWQQAECTYCMGGIANASRIGRYVCQVCEGTGKVWTRK